MKKSKRIIRAILENLIKLLWVFPIDAKKILFFSFQGKQFSDSPKYLSEYIKLHYENYKLCWAFKDLKDFKAGRKFAKKIDKNNFEHIWKGDTKILLRKLHGVDMRVTKK